MKFIYRALILIVSLTVLSVWTFRMNESSPFRGGEAKTMLEEFQAYGLTETQMYVVGAFKVFAALLLLLGLRFPKLVMPGAGIMAIFMIGAVYMHFSIGDGIVPTLPSVWMLVCCVLILVFHRKLYLKQA
jgi:uncharacterized membrane protein YkgB